MIEVHQSPLKCEIAYQTALAEVEFSRRAEKQFEALNRRPGRRYIRSVLLKREVAEYIAAHEAAGCPMDTECQTLRYEGGIYLILRKLGSCWYITEIVVREEALAFEPLYFWQKIRRGAYDLLCHVLIGWKTAVKAVRV